MSLENLSGKFISKEPKLMIESKILKPLKTSFITLL